MLLRHAVLQVLIGGGQDAADVTTTADRAGGFESRFFHKARMLLPGQPMLLAESTLACTQCEHQHGGLTTRLLLQIFTEQIGSVRGHFGPINAVAFHPDGRSFSTGGEDGYVRINHFDNDYLSGRIL